MKKWLSRKATMSAAVATLLVTVLAGTAWALSNITLKLGTVASYDFGGFGPGYPVPATIQVHAFTMDPGDVVPWHYHKGTSYVILAHGTLSGSHSYAMRRRRIGVTRQRAYAMNVATASSTTVVMADPTSPRIR